MPPINGWFSLEAVYAGKGDALILHYGSRTKPKWMLIDGGHTGVYKNFLRPRLEELRLANPGQLNDQHRLPLEMIMVSHADEDHLRGVLDLMANLNSKDPGVPQAAVTVNELWFNGFDDLIAEKQDVADAEQASILDRLRRTASVDEPDDAPLPREAHADLDVRAVIASTAQGRQLVKDAKALEIKINEDYGGGLIMRGGDHSSIKTFSPGLKFTLLGPDKQRVDTLRVQWAKDLVKILAKEQSTAEAVAFKDASAFNLSSIMVLAERGGRTMLLTGDARGDHLIDGLAAENKLDDKGRIHVDLFKLPHHGSDRNVEEATFRDITAANYLISANGEHDNPEPATLDMLKNGRADTRDDAYKVFLTFPEEAFRLISEEDANKKSKVRQQKVALEAVDVWIKTEKPDNMEIVYRQRHRPSLAIDFGEKVFPD